MANNISKDIENSQSTKTRFDTNTMAASSRVASGGSNASEAQRAINIELDRVSYMNLLNMKKQLEEANKHQQNIKSLMDAMDKDYKDYLKSIQEEKKRLEEKRILNSKEGKIKADIALSIKKEEEELEKQAEEKKEEFIKQRTALQMQLKAEQATTDAYEQNASKLEELYGVKLENFKIVQEFIEAEQEALNQAKEAKKIIKADINKLLTQKQELEQEQLSILQQENLTMDNRRRLDEIRDALKDNEEAFEKAKESRSKINRQERLYKRELRQAGLDENGNPSDEKGFDEFAIRAGGKVGQKVGGKVAGAVAGRIAGAEAGAAAGAIGGPIGMAVGSILGGLIFGGSEGGANAVGDMADEGVLPEGVMEIADKLGGPGELINTVKSIMDICGQLYKIGTQYIDQAAEYMKSYFGPIVANLEGSKYTWDAISEKADNLLSTSRWVKQTDYLSKIAELSSAGLLRDIETAAILETIKNKTLSSFDATNEGLRRLIRLNETDYIRQYGIEMQLKRVLNSVFADSGYLQSLFDSVTEAIIDSSTQQRGDVTAFNSTVQTWLGYMYSSGLSSGVITKIAEGVNNLGSGNISALASDEATQRLFLLAMDRVNMDYADVLQQGLSIDDTNKLLASIVQYLDEITRTTDNNLVLKSSYANLFNLSVSDMQAIHQLSGNIGKISSSIVNTAGANTSTISALVKTVTNATSAAEQFDNIIENLQYTYGESVADNGALYSVYRISDITQKVLEPFASVGGVFGKMAQGLQRVAAIPQYPILAYGFLNMLSESGTSVLNSIGPSTSLTQFLSSSLANVAGDASNAVSTMLATMGYTNDNSQLSTISKRNYYNNNGNGYLATKVSSYQAEESWKEEGESDDTKILKEMAKTLMKTTEENHYAFAVSLEGMNDKVLRSFASIFADEDAMSETFTGDNKAIEDSLFNYLDDGTSNAIKQKDKSKASTAGSGSAVKKAATNTNLKTV